MKRLSLLIKPASSLCNMRCKYCFYHDVGEHRENPSYGIMQKETAEKIIANIQKDLDEGDEITIAFQGGEPTLAGLPWFEYFVDTFKSQKKIKTNWALQTNGLLIDDGWAGFLKKHNFLTGLSIDANAGLHNSIRVKANGEGSFEACMKAKAIMDEHKAEYNILCVLTNELADMPDKVWNFITGEKIMYIQFIPCLESFDESESSPYPLKPARFASFYSRLYYWWMKELEKGTYYSVKLFDDTANYFLRGVPSSCGINGRCHAQYVVEADGSVYPCDFYVLDKYNSGNLAQITLREIFDSPVMQAFVSEERKLPPLCNTCKYLKYCNGGCKRMNRVVYFGAPGSPSYGSVCGYKQFLDKCLEPLGHTVRRYFS
ncbi:MAG: SPASM domain-containing protein [Treponema sp.]|nr:SPASM domain-containing protein [Treponema sp.]